MKTLIPITAIAALIASSVASAQTPAFSKPSGYTTQLLRPNRLNYVGLNVLTPSVAAGAITGFRNSVPVSISDSTARFNTTLQPGKMYTVEIVSGSGTGSVREFVQGNSNTTMALSAAISGLKVNDKYIVRKNLTLQELFPSGAPLTTAASTPGAADIVRVPTGSGTFDQYFYKSTTTGGPIGWYTTPDGTSIGTQVTADIPLLYTDGIDIQRRAGANVNLVLTGQVKTTSSRVFAIQGFNPISINTPVGNTLSTLRLNAATALTGHPTSPVTADILWVLNTTGTFTRYWLRTSTTGGAAQWVTTTTGTDVGVAASGATRLTTPYCIIERKGAAKFMTVAAPALYSTL